MKSRRVRSAITSSSSEAFPARSPMPLIVHSICRAPARIASSEFATPSPRSLWQWALITTRSIPGTRFIRSRIRSPNSQGRPYPTVSGMLIVVAPALTAASITRHRKSWFVRCASSAENSTSSVYPFARFTAATAASRTSSGVDFSLYLMWISEVAMKVWMRGRSAARTASQARSMSVSFARAKPAMIGPPFRLCAIARTASKSS